MKEILKVEHLIRNYSKTSRNGEWTEIEVLKDLNFQVEENIMLPMILDKAEVKMCFDNAKKYEEMFEIQHLAKKNPYELSGGEKQRVAICRALINNPDLILADEPTGNLDSRSGKIVVKALEEINDKLGKTIVMVTHDPQVASHCKWIIFLKDGKILNDVKRTGDREKGDCG